MEQNQIIALIIIGGMMVVIAVFCCIRIKEGWKVDRDWKNHREFYKSGEEHTSQAAPEPKSKLLTGLHQLMSCQSNGCCNCCNHCICCAEVTEQPTV